MKNCRVCEQEKYDEEFRPTRRVCKDCERAKGREYRRQNKEKSKKWVEENKDRMRELQSEWYQSNKERINSKFRQRYHDKDSDFKKIKDYRTAINRMLGRTQKTNIYIGCKRENLIKWCEYCFEEDMTMKNYGTFWTVDHVIPLNILKEEPELFDIVTKWYNIMPVTIEYNLKKNKKIDMAQITNHKLKIQMFLEHDEYKLDQKYIKLLARHLDAGNP